MAEILKVESNKVKIGNDDGEVVSIPIASISFANPREGDKVKLYKDGDSYIVKKEGGASSAGQGAKSMNKHIFVWVGAFLFGGFGVDRFMRGQVGTGICKLLFGWLTLGIWDLVDWIIALSKAYGAFSDTDEISFDNAGRYTR